MKRILLIIFAVMLSACQNNSNQPTSEKSQASTSIAGYKVFTTFNDGYDLQYPEDWTKNEKAKRESLHIVGPKPQSASKIQPTINVSMKRGTIRFQDGNSTHQEVKFKSLTEQYEKTIVDRLKNFQLLKKEEKTINGRNSVSLKFSFNHQNTDELLYEEVIFFQLPYRMYTMRLSCLKDEKFRSEEIFDVVKNSFIAKHEKVKDF